MRFPAWQTASWVGAGRRELELHGGLGKLGGDIWFRLGDQDLATHIRRTGLLKNGASLSDATALLSACFGIRCDVMPATDQRLRTMVETDERGRLSSTISLPDNVRLPCSA